MLRSSNGTLRSGGEPDCCNEEIRSLAAIGHEEDYYPPLFLKGLDLIVDYRSLFMR
jgi:hypothetical protein